VIARVKLDNRVDYLALPIVMTFRLEATQPSPISSIYMIVGPRVDFLLGYKAEGVNIVYEKLKTMNIGGDIGIGVEFSIINLPKILAELRYNHDFTNAYETDLLRVKNRSFEILFGLNFKGE